MRTTVSFDPDVEAEIERVRRTEGLGLSEAVNTIARRGIVHATAGRPAKRRSARTFDLAIAIDVTNIGDVLDLLDD